jgi:putative transposase
VKKISKFPREIEIDESYFGAKRVRGERGRGTTNKTPVFLLRFASSCKQTVC